MPLLTEVFEITFTVYVPIKHDRDDNIPKSFHVNNIPSLMHFRLMNNAVFRTEVSMVVVVQLLSSV